ncbi:hypothetical protein ACIRPT_39360 [Streptomyces sp. NPDC101227]|uniref:hypothetical protein n=1 Tax=Streptomyces sp. NPDC101227 TaxID=3366136 RepID=UPI003818009D
MARHPFPMGKAVEGLAVLQENAQELIDGLEERSTRLGPRLEPAVWLMVCCGLRIGESLGVFPEDIVDGTLRCRRQVVRIKNSSGKYGTFTLP